MTPNIADQNNKDGDEKSEKLRKEIKLVQDKLQGITHLQIPYN